jgi:hypothetical protein
MNGTSTSTRPCHRNQPSPFHGFEIHDLCSTSPVHAGWMKSYGLRLPDLIGKPTKSAMYPSTDGHRPIGKVFARGIGCRRHVVLKLESLRISQPY